MRTPVVLLTGVDPDAMATTMVGLQFGLAGAVAVRHHIDPERQLLTRTVSDLGGVIERHEIELAHACVGCAIREDIIPTLERLARDGRWSSIVAHLPVGAEADQICSVLAWNTRLARFMRISAVVAALDAADPVHDLLADDLLCERGVHSSQDDRRGVGEVLAGLVEYADIVSLDAAAGEPAIGLVRTLARPDARLVDQASSLEPEALTGSLHRHSQTDAWSDPARTGELCEPAEGVWQIDLRSPMPFHPERLIDSLELLGGGRHRSRGCFWLPTRPGVVVQWDGAGGQLSIGARGPWGRRKPFTRITVTGVGEAPTHLEPAFDGLLLNAAEHSRGGWQVSEDGFEPWLGPLREVA